MIGISNPKESTFGGRKHAVLIKFGAGYELISLSASFICAFDVDDKISEEIKVLYGLFQHYRDNRLGPLLT